MAMSWCDHLRYQLPFVTVKHVDFLVISVVRILSVFSTLNREKRFNHKKMKNIVTTKNHLLDIFCC